MLQYRSFSEIVDGSGLRIVLVKGLPSPWGQAAKTIFEIKGLDYVAAPWMPGEPNADIVAWGGEASAPIVISPQISCDSPIISARCAASAGISDGLGASRSAKYSMSIQRLSGFSLAHVGIGWNRRLQLFAPAYASGSPPAGISPDGQ